MEGTTDPVPADWDERYRQDHTPWDVGRPHPLLTERLAVDKALGQGVVGRALVPGCGRGWDALALAAAGWTVTALDVADRAVAQATHLLADRGGRALVADAFDWDEPVDLILDHTFFCAIPIRDRPRFGDLCRRTLEQDGGIVSIVFPIGRVAGAPGPPYPMSPDDLSSVLGSQFELVEMGPERKIPPRTWAHRLCRWTRRSDGTG